jgi:3-phytase
MLATPRSRYRSWIHWSGLQWFTLLSAALFFGPAYSQAQVIPQAITAVAVYATVETTPVLSDLDSADDIAIWIHPTNPSLSTVIGTDKRANLEVYDLSGAVLQRVPIKTNNVDIRYNFPLGGQRIALVTGVDRTNNKIFTFKVNPSTRLLEDVSTPQPRLRLLGGSAMYVSPVTGKYYVFMNFEQVLKQYELSDDGNGRVAVTIVREVPFSDSLDLSEGVVADDVYGKVYISEESAAIWKLGAEPSDGPQKTLVDKPLAQGGHFEPDIEGLTLYYKSNGSGYLIGSSQGDSTYVVYTREGNNSYVGTFNIADGAIDETSGTDGIDVTNFPLGPSFPHGVFIAQDGHNKDGNVVKHQNFKLVPFESIAGGLNLTMDTTWDPRKVGAGPLTNTPTPTPTPTKTPLVTNTPTKTPTNTPSPTPTNTPVAGDVIFADGFESGNLSAWSASRTDGSDLSVTAAAALVGNRGMQAQLNDNTVIYVTDDRPTAEPRYRARFYFDPNSIAMVSGDNHYLLYGYSGTSPAVLRVQFRLSNTLYQIRVAALGDNTTWTNSSWFTITDMPHTIELDWKAATAAGANNGALTFWIDGVQKASRTDIDNDTRRIDRVRFGAVGGIDTGTRGVTYFDAFESRRQSYIGLAAGGVVTAADANEPLSPESQIWTDEEDVPEESAEPHLFLPSIHQ